MPSSSFASSPDEQPTITFLLTEVIALLTRELAIVANRRWEDLPGLKREKVVLASRLKSFDWTPDPAVEEPAHGGLLKSRIADLENECRRKIQAQIELISNQVVALQELHQYWRECLGISFRDFHGAVPTA
jgi:hypothetical protein